MEWRSASILAALLLALVATSARAQAQAHPSPILIPDPGRAEVAIPAVTKFTRARELDPKRLVPRDLLATAVKYYDANQSSFTNPTVLGVIDLRPRSDQPRFFVVHLRDGSVTAYHTTHGTGSVDGDPAFAVKFGNEPESNRSSLGFVRTGSVYAGSWGRSLRLQGLSPTNSNMLERAIIIHGDDDAHEANIVQGLSYGCFMLDWKVRDVVIDALRDGSLLYVGLSQAVANRK